MIPVMAPWARCLSAAFAPGLDVGTARTVRTARPSPSPGRAAPAAPRLLAAAGIPSSPEPPPDASPPGTCDPWIVLVDDEPSIRLAVGDYLRGQGYPSITACDGPESFLQAMLWSVSWSIDGGDGGGRAEAPPWIDRRRAGERLWRVPNVIISDIRMPGAGGIDIDGVRLLELIRRSGKRGEEDRVAGGVDRYYSGPDDLELLDAIIRNTAAPQRRITTPSDMAAEYLDKIQECVDMLGPGARCDGPRHVCPDSLAEVPVILLTAKSMTADRAKGLEAGANGYLPKPFRPEELVSLVEGELLKQRREEGASDGGGEDATPEGAEASREAAEAEKLLLGMVSAKRSARIRADGAALRAMLPAAEAMFEDGERRKRLFTRDHIRALLLFRFGRYTTRMLGREKLMALLDEEMGGPPAEMSDVS